MIGFKTQYAHRRALIICFLGLVVCVPVSSSAQTIEPYRVTVVGPLQVYTDPTLEPDELRTPNLSYPALEREILQSFEEVFRFEVVSADEIREGTHQANVIEMEFMDYVRDTGISQFGLFELDSAIDNLEQSLSLYEDAEAWFQRPREMALAQEYLARTRLARAFGDEVDENELTAARRAFKGLIRLDPSRQFRAGLFPETVVSVFNEAYLELLYDDGRELGLSLDAVIAFGSRHNLDIVVHPFVLKDGDGLRLVMDIIDLNLRQRVFREAIVLTGETAGSRELVNRALSRYISCVPLRWLPVESPHMSDARRFFLHAGWGLNFYGEKPTPRQFLNQGLGLMFDYMMTDNLGLFGRSSLLFGSRDPDGTLVTGFNSIRSATGVLLSHRSDRVRLWLGLGVEYNRTGSIQATDEFWCRVSGGDAVIYDTGKDCQNWEVISVEPQNLVGPFVMPGISVTMAEPFGFYISGNFAFYLTQPAVDIGFPMSAETGIEYGF